MPEHELVMPFVVCESVGGPYADEAFVAGYWCGHYDALMERGEAPGNYVPAGIVPQLDLVAMRHGFTMTAEPWEDDSFHVLVEFAKVAEP